MSRFAVLVVVLALTGAVAGGSLTKKHPKKVVVVKQAPVVKPKPVVWEKPAPKETINEMTKFLPCCACPPPTPKPPPPTIVIKKVPYKEVTKVFGKQFIYDPKVANGVQYPVAAPAAAAGRKMLGVPAAKVVDISKDYGTVYVEEEYSFTKMPNVVAVEDPCYAAGSCTTPPPKPPAPKPGNPWLNGQTDLKYAITSYPTAPPPTPSPPPSPKPSPPPAAHPYGAVIITEAKPEAGSAYAYYKEKADSYKTPAASAPVIVPVPSFQCVVCDCSAPWDPHTLAPLPPRLPNADSATATVSASGANPTANATAIVTNSTRNADAQALAQATGNSTLPATANATASAQTVRQNAQAVAQAAAQAPRLAVATASSRSETTASKSSTNAAITQAGSPAQIG